MIPAAVEAERAAPGVFLQDRGGPERRGLSPGPAPDFPLQPLWSRPGPGFSRAVPAADQERLYVMGSGNGLSCLSRDGGGLLWNFPAPPPASAAPAVGEGQVFMMDGEGALCALSAAEGRVIWRREGGEPSVAALLLTEGTLVTAGIRGKVAAFRASDGEVLWERDLKAPLYAAPSAADGRVFVGAESGLAAALALEDGRELWKRELPGRISGPLIPWGDGVFGAVTGAFSGGASGPGGGEYFFLDGATGDLRWSWRSGSGILAPGVVDKGSAIFADTEGTVLSVRLDTGIVRWRRMLHHPVSMGITLTDGAVLTMTEDSVLYRLDGETGEVTGRTVLPPAVSTPPLCLDGVVYLATLQGDFRALQGAGEEGRSRYVPLPEEPVFPPILTPERDLEIFLPRDGLLVELAPVGGRHYIEVMGEPPRPVALRLLDREASVLAENLGYTALEKGFEFRFDAKKTYILKAEPVKLDEGLVPVWLRIRPLGRGS